MRTDDDFNKWDRRRNEGDKYHQDFWMVAVDELKAVRAALVQGRLF